MTPTTMELLAFVDERIDHAKRFALHNAESMLAALRALVAQADDAERLVEEIKDCCLRGKLSYGLGVALAAYKAVSAPRAAEGKEEK